MEGGGGADTGITCWQYRLQAGTFWPSFLDFIGFVIMWQLLVELPSTMLGCSVSRRASFNLSREPQPPSPYPLLTLPCLVRCGYSNLPINTGWVSICTRVEVVLNFSIWLGLVVSQSICDCHVPPATIFCLSEHRILCAIIPCHSTETPNAYKFMCIGFSFTLYTAEVVGHGNH